MTKQKVLEIFDQAPYEVAVYLNKLLGNGTGWYISTTNIQWIQCVADSGSYIRGYGIVVLERYDPTYKYKPEDIKDNIDNII